jgi:Ser/Thr protein kinase RdoA (MazF antagonist)
MAMVDTAPTVCASTTFTDEKVLQDLQRHYNLTGTIKQLGCSPDISFRLVTSDAQKYLVKYLNKSMNWNDISFQHQVLDYLESFHAQQPFVFPYPMKRVDDGKRSSVVEQTDENGEKYYLCVLNHIEGVLLSEFKYLHPSALFEIGKDIALFNKLLSSFPLSDDYTRFCEWDLRKSYDVCDQRKDTVKDVNYQNKLMLVAFKNYEIVLQHDNSLRHQLVHGDLADYNMIAEKGSLGRPKIKGIIDFGDVVESWLVGDLAICIVTLLSRKNQNLMSMIIPIIQGFCSVNQLNESELRCLWHLILLRSTLLYINVAASLENDPTNEYLLKEQEINHFVLERLLEIPLQYAISTVLCAGGIQLNGESSFDPAVSEFPLFRSDFIRTMIPVDLSSTNPMFVNGNWKNDGGITAKIVRQTILDSFPPVDEMHTSLLAKIVPNRSRSNSSSPGNVFEIKFGSSWFSHSEAACLSAPRSIPTFSIYYLPRSTKLFSPWNGTAKVCDESAPVMMLFEELKKINKETRFGSFTSPKVLEISNEEYTVLIYGISVSSPLIYDSSWTIHQGNYLSFIFFPFLIFSFRY